MSCSDIIAISIAFAAAVFAGLAWWNARQTMRHHLISELRKDYLSPQLHHAVKTLWQFYEECGENFVEKYEEKRKEEEEWLSNLNRLEMIKAEQSTLHYQRRLLSHFYQYVATLYLDKILPKGIVFKTWSESDLRIIPEVIVPIENKLREVLHTPPLPPLDEKNYSPLVLYRDSRDCN
jgi:hypothetical protein